MNFLTIACVVLAFAGAILAEPVAIPGGGDLVGKFNKSPKCIYKNIKIVID